MFPTEQAWMINPHRSRRKRRSRSTNKRGSHMARSRKRRRAKKIIVVNKPRRRRRRAVSRRRRRASVKVIRMNPRRRRRSSSRVRHRRHYRRNPGMGLPSTGFIMDAAYVTGGFFATRFAAGFVLPMIPGADTMPIMRIAGKGVVAWGLGWLGGRFLGAKAGQLLLLGGLVETLSDAVRTYVSPFVPALAEGMGSYPALSSYPNLSGDYSDPYGVGRSEMGYDEAL